MAKRADIEHRVESLVMPIIEEGNFELVDVEYVKEVSDIFVHQLSIAFDEFNLQPLPVFLEKCIEFHETTLIRHGIMLIGNSFVGKTSTWKVLAQALTNMWYDSLHNNEGNSESSLLSSE